MHNSLRFRNYKINLQLVMLVVAVCILGVIPRGVAAQSKSAGREKSPLCNRENAVEMIHQQIDLTKTFKNSVQRITVLIRAADLLWPYEQDKARAVLNEAFESAIENEKENEQKALAQ
jgi:hypothetical protein